MSENTATAAEQTAMPKHGQICWSEIATTDAEACKSFYGEMFGWKFKESDATEMQYSEFSTDESGCPVGGLHQMDKEYGEMPSHWMNYVAVEDVDSAAAKATELGGTIRVPPMDIPNVGRFCVLSDPTGAAFSIIKLNPLGPS